MKNRYRRAGFSLPELIMTFALLAILGTIIIPVWSGGHRYAEVKAAEGKAAALDRAKMQYLVDNGASAYASWAACVSDAEKFEALKEYLTQDGSLSWLEYATTAPRDFSYSIGELNGRTTVARTP